MPICNTYGRRANGFITVKTCSFPLSFPATPPSVVVVMVVAKHQPQLTKTTVAAVLVAPPPTTESETVPPRRKVRISNLSPDTCLISYTHKVKKCHLSSLFSPQPPGSHTYEPRSTPPGGDDWCFKHVTWHRRACLTSNALKISIFAKRATYFHCLFDLLRASSAHWFSLLLCCCEAEEPWSRGGLVKRGARAVNEYLIQCWLTLLSINNHTVVAAQVAKII